MQSLREKLRYISSSQGAEVDGCRIFADGKIQVRTPTVDGGEGWMMIAKHISGAGPMFGHFFESAPRRFLKVRDLRQALEIRDQMLVEATQDRTIRTMKKSVRKDVLKKMRTKSKRVIPEIIVGKEDKTEESRTPTTLFL